MSTDRCPTSDQLNEFVTGKLGLDVHDAIEQHLDACAACQETVEILDEQSGTLFSGLKDAAGETPAGFDPTLEQLVERAKLLGLSNGPIAENVATKGWPGSQPPLQPGSVLGNYVVGEPLGGGAMGFVYRAYHKRMKRDVALKFISPALVESADARLRFQREIEAAAQLNHPNVVTAYDADEVDGYCFLVQELIRGSDLRQVVKRDGPLSIDRALRYVLHAARGLQCAHDARIIHRDVKPSNLLLDDQDVVHVADLGLARLEHALDGSPTDEISRTGIVAGTPAYMSPEQRLDLRATDHRTDVYSLGCTLAYLLTGKVPIELKDPSAAATSIGPKSSKSIRHLRPECPVEVEQLCQSMAAAAVEDRPQTMAAVVEELERLVEKFDQGEVAAQSRQASSPSRRVTAALIFGAAALLGVLLVGPLFRDQSDSTSQPAEATRPNAAGTPETGSDSATPAPATPAIELVRIEPGQFQMGSPAGTNVRRDETPPHEVEITRPFLLGKFEVTVTQFTEVMGSDGTEIGQAESPEDQSAGLPMSGITWLEAVEFCNRLSQRHGLEPFYEIDGKIVSVRRGSDGFRLPTEAEWEFACRADSQTPWSFGDDAAKLNEFAWFADNSGGVVHPVGTKKPNAWGLHDMHGNVPEWCWDRYDPEYYARSEAIDPPGSSSGDQRVFRGGGASNRAAETRSAVRNPLGATYGFFNNVGLRVARSIDR